MEASGQTGPAEGTGSMPEGEVSGAMTAPAAETTPVVPETQYDHNFFLYATYGPIKIGRSSF